MPTTNCKPAGSSLNLDMDAINWCSKQSPNERQPISSPIDIPPIYTHASSSTNCFAKSAPLTSSHYDEFGQKEASSVPGLTRTDSCEFVRFRPLRRVDSMSFDNVMAEYDCLSPSSSMMNFFDPISPKKSSSASKLLDPFIRTPDWLSLGTSDMVAFMAPKQEDREQQESREDPPALKPSQIFSKWELSSETFRSQLSEFDELREPSSCLMGDPDEGDGPRSSTSLTPVLNALKCSTSATVPSMPHLGEAASPFWRPRTSLSLDSRDPAGTTDDNSITTGIYTKAERRQKILRFREKRERRNFSKKVLYSCRKQFADSRPRVGGRFVAADHSSKKVKNHGRGRPKGSRNIVKVSKWVPKVPRAGSVGLVKGSKTVNGPEHEE